MDVFISALLAPLAVGDTILDSMGSEGLPPCRAWQDAVTVYRNMVRRPGRAMRLASTWRAKKVVAKTMQINATTRTVAAVFASAVPRNPLHPRRLECRRQGGSASGIEIAGRTAGSRARIDGRGAKGGCRA